MNKKWNEDVDFMDWLLEADTDESIDARSAYEGWLASRRHPPFPNLNDLLLLIIGALIGFIIF